MKHKSTQELAKDAADQLLEQGVRPTQQNVRALLGTGSITTINKALNSWWQELGQRLKANSVHPMIPDPVAESASKLWRQALAYAEKELESKRASLEQEYRAKQREFVRHTSDDAAELKDLRAQCLRLLSDVERLSEEKNQLLTKLSDSENKLFAESAKVDDLNRQVRQKEALSEAGPGLDEFISLQVSYETMKEQCKRLNKQLDKEISEKVDLQSKLAGALKELELLKS